MARGFAGTEIDYEGDNVSFVVDGDTLKVMADVTVTTKPRSSLVSVLIVYASPSRGSCRQLFMKMLMRRA